MENLLALFTSKAMSNFYVFLFLALEALNNLCSMYGLFWKAKVPMRSVQKNIFYEFIYTFIAKFSIKLFTGAQQAGALPSQHHTTSRQKPNLSKHNTTNHRLNILHRLWFTTSPDAQVTLQV